MSRKRSGSRSIAAIGLCAALLLLGGCEREPDGAGGPEAPEATQPRGEGAGAEPVPEGPDWPAAPPALRVTSADGERTASPAKSSCWAAAPCERETPHAANWQEDETLAEVRMELGSALGFGFDLPHASVAGAWWKPKLWQEEQPAAMEDGAVKVPSIPGEYILRLEATWSAGREATYAVRVRVLPEPDAPPSTASEPDVPEGWMLRREMRDADGTASYSFREYEAKHSAELAHQWYLGEVDRLGGTVIASYGGGEDGGKEEGFAAIAEVASPLGNETLSLYYGSYAGTPNVTLLRTSYASGLQEQSASYIEDHPLVVTVPLADGTMKEVFRGYYEHQHTDIYVAYFLTGAFFKELERTEGAIRAEPKYAVGYFDGEGLELVPGEDEIGPETPFGVKFEPGALPEAEKERAAFLSALARTVLLGDKALYRNLPAERALHFWIGDDRLTSVTVGELLSSGK